MVPGVVTGGMVHARSRGSIHRTLWPGASYFPSRGWKCLSVAGVALALGFSALAAGIFCGIPVFSCTCECIFVVAAWPAGWPLVVSVIAAGSISAAAWAPADRATIAASRLVKNMDFSFMAHLQKIKKGYFGTSSGIRRLEYVPVPLSAR